jgi:hypothetical protein
MHGLRQHHRQRPSLLSQLRRQALILLGMLLALLLTWPAAVAAAEVFQVGGARLLQVGDGNRSYTVQLACLEVVPAQEDQAIAWLRQALPRRTRVNLRPFGERDGMLLARVSRLADGEDLGAGLIAAGLATPMDCP